MGKDFKSNCLSIKNGELSDLSVRLREKCASLSTVLHPVTLNSVKEIINIGNAYYSCKAEGHEISLSEIEKGLSGNFSRHKSKKLIQHEAAAYYGTRIEIKERISNEPDLNICSLEFISWLHVQLFEKLPDEFKRMSGKEEKIIYLIPGELRKEGIIKHRNGFPKAKQVRKLLIRFEEILNPAKFTLAELPISLALAHCMFSWIHPFPVGSATVLRLFTGAYIEKCGAEIFLLNRAVFNKYEEYRTSISESYKHIKNLKAIEDTEMDEHILSFCVFFLQILFDEADFMLDMLKQENITHRIESYAVNLAEQGSLREECKLILKTVFLSGQMKRGDVLQMTGRPERTARRILGELLQKKLLISDSPKGPVRINFTMKSANETFKDLF
jgi:Fic family protein